MKISIASDHGGFDLKEDLRAWLTGQGHEVVDFGCHGKESCDYPDFAGPAARAAASGECERGIVICTTGIGVSMTANKVKGVRCALCADTLTAQMTRLHNDANVLALGGGIVGPNLGISIVDTFLNTAFSEEEKHCRRVGLIEQQ